jgi:hypothetical protein
MSTCGLLQRFLPQLSPDLFHVPGREEEMKMSVESDAQFFRSFVMCEARRSVGLLLILLGMRGGSSKPGNVCRVSKNIDRLCNQIGGLRKTKCYQV